MNHDSYQPLRDPEGRLTYPLPLGTVRAPGSVEIVEEGDELGLRAVWGFSEESPRASRFDLTGVLESFARLSQAAPEEIQRFAEEWGMLNLCEAHKLPTSHTATGEATMEVEPIPMWKGWATQAEALLKIGSKLSQSLLPERTLWTDYYGPGYEPDVWRFIGTLPPNPMGDGEHKPGDVIGNRTPRIQDDRGRLSTEISRWLQLGDVRPSLIWASDGTPALQLGGQGVFGAIAVQMMYAVSAWSGLYICSGCGRPYQRDRKPQRNRRNFCMQCVAEGIPERLRQRDRRARDQGRPSDKQLSEEGTGS